jgi:hypothetical protein
MIEYGGKMVCTDRANNSMIRKWNTRDMIFCVNEYFACWRYEERENNA